MRSAVLVTYIGMISIPLIPPAEANPIVFFDDLDGGQTFAAGVSGGLSGITSTVSVEGYSGLGTGGNLFADDFLINGSGGDPAPSTVLTLAGLPPHTTIDLAFLLAIIDTWDGTSFPPVPSQAPDFFNVQVDGAQVFSETFANADAATGQTYSPPPGVELANGVQLGFRSANVNDLDDAYDMGLDPAFIGIPHTASSVTIAWFASGAGWGGGIAVDESWAIDNIQVSVNVIPEAAGGALWACILLAARGSRSMRRRRG